MIRYTSISYFLCPFCKSLCAGEGALKEHIQSLHLSGSKKEQQSKFHEKRRDGDDGENQNNDFPKTN